MQDHPFLRTTSNDSFPSFPLPSVPPFSSRFSLFPVPSVPPPFFFISSSLSLSPYVCFSFFSIPLYIFPFSLFHFSPTTFVSFRFHTSTPLSLSPFPSQFLTFSPFVLSFFHITRSYQEMMERGTLFHDEVIKRGLKRESLGIRRGEGSASDRVGARRGQRREYLLCVGLLMIKNISRADSSSLLSHRRFNGDKGGGVWSVNTSCSYRDIKCVTLSPFPFRGLNKLIR